VKLDVVIGSMEELVKLLVVIQSRIQILDHFSTFLTIADLGSFFGGY